MAIRFAAVLIASMLAGCASGPEGVFQPACTAYAGERIELDKGRYEWHRFTDTVSVDDRGNRLDPFPDYPKTGRYEREGARVRLIADDGTPLSERYLVDHDGRTWLLSADQYEAFLNGQAMPPCALVLADD